jgi:hypothetical protein
MKKAYSPVIIHNTSIKTPEKGQVIKLQIENRFDFTNLNECRIEWDMAREKGKLKMKLPPRSSGILRIHPETNPEGKTMHIRIYSPLGYLVDETTISIGKIERADYFYKPLSEKNYSVDSTSQFYIVNSDRTEWRFSRTEGKLVSANLDRQTLLTGNTELMILPLNTGPCATEHSLDIPVLNNKCSDWEPGNVISTQNHDTVKITIHGKYLEASGEIQYVFIPDGGIRINYRFHSGIEINPRQWGLVLNLDGTFKNLEWSRKGIWTEYPEDHIGRTRGKAVPFVTGTYQKPAFGKMPANKWYHDANELGTNDFRSTKDNIYWTTLTDDSGKGIVIHGKGLQSTRAWQTGSDINLLVTGFSTGGGDLFFSGYYKDERRPLAEGDVLEGSIELFMIESE